MSRLPKPFNTPRRTDSRTYQITLNKTCGLPARVCDEWRRRSFQDFPDDLAQYRNPKNKAAAETAAFALITFLKKKQDEGDTRHVVFTDITVGNWLERFTRIETSPRTGINASKNRPYSIDTLKGYRCYFTCHIQDDPIASLKMAEIEEEDILEYMTRLSLKKKVIGGKKKQKTDIPLGGTRTFAGVVKFIKMAFEQYQRKNRKWLNPFLFMENGIVSINSRERDALPEDEILRFFKPGVLKTPMELAVCAAMFLSGLRRAEIFALKPCDLDWDTPRITVCRAWQSFDSLDKVLGPPKGKKERKAPFDPVLQEAIKKLWKENGKHEFVFSRADGSIPGSSWISSNFNKWLNRAGIVLNGRNIVPHSSRHSIASLLEERDVPLRYIQEFLGHSDLKKPVSKAKKAKK